MKLYDEIRLAVREGKKCLPYLIITALMFAIVSAVASCLFLTAVNLRRDYYDYLDKQTQGGHEFIVTCGYTAGVKDKLSECGFDKAVHLSSADYDAGIYVSDSGKKIGLLQNLPLYFIDELLSEFSGFDCEMIGGEDIKPCFDTPGSDSMWIDEYIALSESLAVGDKLSVKSKEKTIKEYTIAGIYSGENTFFAYPVIVPFNSYYDSAVANNRQIDSVFSCTISSMHQYDKTVTAARQNGFDIDASAFEMGITAINYAYILFIGLAVLFAGIAFFSVLNTFSVTIAKRSHIMTNFILLGAKKNNVYAIYFIPYFSSLLLGAAIGFLLMHLLFSYVSSLTKSLLCFEVALETASGIVGISAFALLFIAVLAVMLYCKFRTLSGINLSDTVREYDR